ncbi:MAG: 3-phosphoshikimate 1-carboxyvinyltransferase [Sphingobacteriaceae bacterium]|nr:3-phosphoshikimate 1-carboxyvinyltransferase [Sphingobacteriaceae bacterium]
MMQVAVSTKLQPATRPLSGPIALPGSKSASNRLLILRALANANTQLLGLSTAADTAYMQAALQQITAQPGGRIFAGAAGTVMRFLLPVLALRPGIWELYGSDRAHERPIGPLVDALRSLGAKIDYLDKEGFPPLRIEGGTLNGGDVQLPAHQSSQFATALLLVGARLPGGLQLQLTGELVSRPYLQQTIELLAACGVKVQQAGNTYTIAEQYINMPAVVQVEPDWSSAAYWLAWVAAVPGSELLLENLPLYSHQADSRAVEWMGPLGVKVTGQPNGLLLRHQTPEITDGRNYDGRDCPDLVPAQAVLCALQQQPALFTGLATLRLKESDRIEALAVNLRAAGAVVSSGPDWLHIEKGIPEGAGEVHVQCFHDHRMALAFSVLAAAQKTVIFDQPEVVAKSYPNYWEQLATQGINFR